MKRIYFSLVLLFISFCTKSQTFPSALGGEFKFTFIENKKVFIEFSGIATFSQLNPLYLNDSMAIIVENKDTFTFVWLKYNSCLPYPTVVNCLGETPDICNPPSYVHNGVPRVLIYSKVIDFKDNDISFLLNNNNCKINFLTDSSRRSIIALNLIAGNGNYRVPAVTAQLDLCYDWKSNEESPRSTDLNLYHIIPLNTPFYYSITANANANDSFAYESITPIVQPAYSKKRPFIDQQMEYMPGYSADFPITVYCPFSNCSPSPLSNPPRGFSVNRFTGEIAFTPVYYGDVSWFKFRIHHYRKDSNDVYKHVGFMDKDFFKSIGSNVINQTPPSFTGPRIVQACTNDSLRFEIAINDGNTTHPDSLTEITLGVQSNLPPDAKIYLKDSSASNKILVVEWPQTKTIYPFKPTNYFLLLTAGYKSCGVLRDVVAYYTSTIYVHPKPIPKAKVDSVSRCGVVYFSSNKFTNSPYTLQWSIKNMADTAFTTISSAVADSLPLYKAGYYVLKLTANVTTLQCFGYDYDTFFVNEPMAMRSQIQAPESLCDNLSLQAIVRSENVVYPASFLWSYAGASLPTNDSSISFKPISSGKLLLRIRDARGCEKTDSTSVVLHPSPVFHLHPNRYRDTILCQGQQVTLVSPIAPDSSHSLLWLPDSTSNSSLLVNTEKNVVLQVLNQFGCSSADTLFVGVNPLPSPDSLSLRICAGSLATLKAPVPPAFNSISFAWKQNNNTIGTDSILQRTLLNNAAFSLDYSYSYRQKTCSQSHNFFVVALPKPKPNFVLSDTALCLRNNLFTATDISPAAASRSWINPDAGTASDSVYRFSLQNHGAFSLGLALVNAQGCADTLYKPLRTLPNPVAFASVLQQRPCLAR
jgi:hypothetical protein